MDQDSWSSFEPSLKSFLGGLKAKEVQKQVWTTQAPASFEGFVTESGLGHVIQGVKLSDLGYTPHGSISIISNLLRRGYIWDEVRLKGNAYGGGCGFDLQSGVFRLRSWRDPNIPHTLKVFNSLPDYLRSIKISDEDIKKAIVAAIGEMDAPDLPPAEARQSFARYMAHISTEDRQKWRDEILNTSIKHFHELGEILEGMKDKSQLVMCGPKASLEEANEALGGKLVISKML